jgi:hypothetical protein
MKITVQMTILVEVSTAWPGSVMGSQVYREAKQTAENVVDRMLHQSNVAGDRVTRKSTDKVLAVLTELHGDDAKAGGSAE